MADNNVRRAWDFYNGKMPNDFFPDIMDTPRGAIYKPMNTPIAPDEGGCDCEQKENFFASVVALSASALSWLSIFQDDLIYVNLKPFLNLWDFVNTPINVIAYIFVWTFYPGNFHEEMMLILIFVEWFILALIVMTIWSKLRGK